MFPPLPSPPFLCKLFGEVPLAPGFCSLYSSRNGQTIERSTSMVPGTALKVAGQRECGHRKLKEEGRPGTICQGSRGHSRLTQLHGEIDARRQESRGKGWWQGGLVMQELHMGAGGRLSSMHQACSGELCCCWR